jgi:hypothetical protein
MKLGDLYDLVMKVHASAQSMGIDTASMDVVELNMKNDPPTLTCDSVATDDVPSIRIIAVN